MPFCKDCGKEVKAGDKFCSGCGASLTNETPSSKTQQDITPGTICKKCGSIIPFGNIACTNCGSLLNQDKHTTAIVLGYICSIFIPLFGIIFGIYLLTRPNKDVHKHGVIMIIISIAMIIIYWLFLSYMSYRNRIRYYNNYYYNPSYYDSYNY